MCAEHAMGVWATADALLVVLSSARTSTLQIPFLVFLNYLLDVNRVQCGLAIAHAQCRVISTSTTVLLVVCI
jgi:hypothetical protein